LKLGIERFREAVLIYLGAGNDFTIMSLPIGAKKQNFVNDGTLIRWKNV